MRHELQKRLETLLKLSERKEFHGEQIPNECAQRNWVDHIHLLLRVAVRDRSETIFLMMNFKQCIQQEKKMGSTSQ